MSQDIQSPENIDFLAMTLNREIKHFIGKVKDKNDFSLNTEMGIETSIRYKQPMIYDSAKFEDIRIVSFIVSKQLAKTKVWARPLKGSCLSEIVLQEFSSEYEPHELPLRHSKTVDALENYHLWLIKQGNYFEKPTPLPGTNKEENELPF